MQPHIPQRLVQQSSLLVADRVLLDEVPSRGRNPMAYLRSPGDVTGGRHVPILVQIWSSAHKLVANVFEVALWVRLPVVKSLAGPPEPQARSGCSSGYHPSPKQASSRQRSFPNDLSS